jgi:hypothetical protein
LNHGEEVVEDMEHMEAAGDTVRSPGVVTTSKVSSPLDISLPPAETVEILNPLVCVSGTADIDVNLICVCQNGFPSVGCRGFAVSEGKWYYELTLLTAGCIQVGWVDSSFTGNSDQGQGVGDDAHSWAFDGWRVCCWHEIAADWGAKWDVGDVVGCAVDLDTRDMSFFLNGHGADIDMGTAFAGVNCLGGLYPCVSFSRKESIQFNFGSLPFRYQPPAGYSPFSVHVNSCLNDFKKDVSVSEDATILLKKYLGWPFTVSDSVASRAASFSTHSGRLIIDDSLEECREVRELDWRKRYFQPDEAKGVSPSSRNSLQSADVSASYQIPGSPRKTAAEFVAVSRDLQVLYCRSALLRIFSVLPSMSTTLAAQFVKALTEKQQGADATAFENMLVLLRMGSMTSSRTRAHRNVMGSVPNCVAVPFNLGDDMYSGGPNFLYSMTRPVKEVLRQCRIQAPKVIFGGCQAILKALVECIRADTMSSALREYSNSWKLDGFAPTVVVGKLNSGCVNEVAQIPSLTSAVWVTNIIVDFLAEEVGVFLGETAPDGIWDGVVEILCKVCIYWVTALRSPNVAVKTCACRTVSVILQEFTVSSPGARFSHAPPTLLIKLANVVPVSKLNSFVYSRLCVERGAQPIASELVQASLELLFSASQIPSSGRVESNEQIRRSQFLWGEIDECDPGYDWESISGRLMSNNGWIPWTGSLKQLGVSNVPTFERRASPDRQNEPPELMPGCRVSVITATAAVGDSDSDISLPRLVKRSLSSSASPESCSMKQFERIGTVTEITSWQADDPLPGLARVVRWDDDGSEQTIRWGAENMYDVCHLKIREGNIVGKYPAPAKRLYQLYNNSFGLEATFGIILRLREACHSSDELIILQSTYGDDVPDKKLLGIMEWPDFSAVVQVSGHKWGDGRWILTEEYLLVGTQHSPWGIRFGHSHWRCGTTYDFSPSRDSINDITDKYSGRMVGGFNYVVKTPTGNSMVVGDVFIQRSHLFVFDDMCKGPKCNVVLESTTASKSNDSGQTCVFGNVGFSSGVHYWEFKVEQADHGSVFIGVAEKPFPPGTPASVITQRMSRWFGIGFCNNRVSFRSGTNGQGDRLTSYGETFVSGDVVGVLLDMNRGRLSFFLDSLKYGEHSLTDLGEAFDQLATPYSAKPRTLFPIVGLQKALDRITITPRWLSTVSIPSDDDLCLVGKAWRLLTCWSLERQTSAPFKEDLWTYRAGWREWLRLNAGRYVRVKTRCRSLNMQLVLDTNPIACVEASIRLGLPRALFRGDRILFSLSSGRKLEVPEEAIILGACHGQLWYRLESQHGDVASVESGQPAWSLAPYDVDGFCLLRRGYHGQDKFPTLIADLTLPRLPPFQGGLLYLSHTGGAVMRTGIEIDSSEMICTTPPFITVYATERRVNSSSIARYKIFHDGKHGWVSERMRGGSEEVMLSRVASASETELAEAQRIAMEAAAALVNVAHPIIREDVKSLADAMTSWQNRMTEAGFGCLVEAWKTGAFLAKDASDSTFERYMDLASTMDGVKNWSVEADMQLVELVSRTAMKLGVSPQNVSHESIVKALRLVESPTSLLYRINRDRAIARVALVRVANQIFLHTLPYLSVSVPEEKLRKDITGSETVIEVIHKFTRPVDLVECANMPPCEAGKMSGWNPPCSAKRLRTLRRLLFFQTKNAFWESVLDSTSTPTALQQDEYEDPREIKTIKLNRIKANNARLATLSSATERFGQTVFGQLYKEMRNWSSSAFRRSYLGKGHGGQKRAFKVKFLGEGVNDYGGPYRAVFEQIVDELQTYTSVAGKKMSETCLLPLLVPCSNRASGLGANQDKYVFAPGASSPSIQEYMNFFGKLVGTAVRHNLSLGLDLSALVWRPLTRVPLGLAQLVSVDALAAKAMDSIYSSGLAAEKQQNIEDADVKVSKKFIKALTPPEWADYSLTVNLPDGARLALVPGGESKPVSMSNWRLFLSLAEAARLRESEVLYKCFRDGLGQVLPSELLPLFTPDELEQLITGSSKVDLVLLKQCTEYENVNPESSHVHNFWEVIEEMSDEEKTLFLRFVWARSRMPSSLENLPMNFKIQGPQGPARENPDEYLPSAQTCFFSLALPAYSTKEVLRSKLLYAINNSPNMDADVRLHSGEGWAES